MHYAIICTIQIICAMCNNMRYAIICTICAMQYVPCNMHNAICTMECELCSTHHTICTIRNALCNNAPATTTSTTVINTTNITSTTVILTACLRPSSEASLQDVPSDVVLLREIASLDSLLLLLIAGAGLVGTTAGGSRSPIIVHRGLV